VYLDIEARPNEPFVTKSLDASGLHLLRVYSITRMKPLLPAPPSSRQQPE